MLYFFFFFFFSSRRRHTRCGRDWSSDVCSSDLTLAGVTRQIQMDVNVEETSEGIRYTGSVPLKMSDFEIRPPTAMFGALRTGDEVTVGFDVVFVPQG